MNAQPASFMQSTLESLFACKAWANEELFESLSRIDASAYSAEVHNAIRILNHVYVVDSIFKGHLEGLPHGHTGTNTQDTPTLGDLAARVKVIDRWYQSYVLTTPKSALTKVLAFTFTDGDSGVMTSEEILLHVATHGAYHRGAAGQAMRTTNVAPPRDLFTRFLRLARMDPLSVPSPQ